MFFIVDSAPVFSIGSLGGSGTCEGLNTALRGRLPPEEIAEGPLREEAERQESEDAFS